MTSGQGGPYGSPEGQPDGTPGPGEQPGQGTPQGWGAPPPQQGWNAPPPPQQGWNAPPPPQQGWNAPPPPQGQYGYAPAPSAPTGYGAPTPMERPTTVRAGIGAFIASLILGVISSIVSFADIDGIVAQAVAVSDDPGVTEDVIRAGIIIGVVIALILYALYVLFLWFAWKGRNWARIVLWVLGGLSVVFGLAGSAAGAAPGQSGFQTSLGWFGILLTVAGIVLLALKPSNDWYKFRGWQRATGQG